MAFSKWGYGWILLIGLGLVLLAAITWLVNVDPAESAAIPPRVLVEEAVSVLNPCLTCHSSTSSNTKLAAFPAHEHVPHDDQTVLAAADLQAKLDHELYQTGNRILDLPQTESPAYDAVLSDYLQLYESSRAITDPQLLRGALDYLDQLEQLLAALEHQASPYKWKPTSTGQPTKTGSAVVPGSPPPTSAALAQHTFWIEPNPVKGRYSDMTIFAPVRVVFAAYRRGPPAETMMITARWKTRLPSWDAPSRFSLVENVFTGSEVV